jgi:hypothetical protein
MSATIAECLEHVRKCELCAAKTNDEQDRQLLFTRRGAVEELAAAKELEIRASARAAA